MALSTEIKRGCLNTVLFSDMLPAGVDPTTYAGTLSLCSIAAAGTNRITGATNATPIVITSVAHGLTTGDQVAIVNVGGNGAAKGVHTITVVDADTFSLNSSVSSGTFTLGGEWYKCLPTVAGLAFSGSPPQVTIGGLTGLAQDAGYVMVINITGSHRDDWVLLVYVSTVDSSV